MEAQWRSKCPCGDWIEEGDEIVQEEGEWIHKECSEEPDEWDWDEW